MKTPLIDMSKTDITGESQAFWVHGVSVKVLTGDNELVTRKVCTEVGIHAEKIVIGSQVETMSDAQLAEAVDTTTCSHGSRQRTNSGSSKPSSAKATSSGSSDRWSMPPPLDTSTQHLLCSNSHRHCCFGKSGVCRDQREFHSYAGKRGKLSFLPVESQRRKCRKQQSGIQLHSGKRGCKEEEDSSENRAAGCKKNDRIKEVPGNNCTDQGEEKHAYRNDLHDQGTFCHPDFLIYC
jgi:hypothetical protein